jgi:phosphopantothenoylcysteine decarboxylase/phosphopantothenate--cysteine ligase
MKCPTIVAPAMDLDMYVHPTTHRNLDQLIRDGVTIIPAESGQLASGLEGEGRMAEPETIVEAIDRFFNKTEATKALNGKKILITAGPTYEAIDPVRFIGNHSSGKMGFALAQACLNQGAEVILISGPTQETLSHPNLTCISIVSAEELFAQVKEFWETCSIGIFSAAVADYRPEVQANQKIKKSEEHLQLSLVKNPDVLSWAGSVKKDTQLLIGFALETTNLLENATDKLTRKNLDIIVMNTLEDEGAGFGHATNKIALLDAHNNFTKFELKSKLAVAKDIVTYLINYKK